MLHFSGPDDEILANFPHFLLLVDQ
jgi:hypothetical protein